MDAQQCCGQVRKNTNWPGHRQCSRVGVIERDKKWYCKQHDPVAKKERSDERYKKFSEKWDRDAERVVRSNVTLRACEGLTNEQIIAIPRLVKWFTTNEAGGMDETAELEAIYKVGGVA